ncbi:hypothetical protein ES705_11569 [subsurface metagenome]
MSPSLHKYLKGIKISELVTQVKDKDSFQKILSDLNLDQDYTYDDLVDYFLKESKEFLNKEKRTEALIILKAVKPLLTLVSKRFYIPFYLVLTDSFMLINDFQGAEKAAKKAQTAAAKFDDPQYQIRVWNRLFIIYRTLEKDKSYQYLVQSKELAQKHDLYENIVFCEVNLGLMHLFNKDYTKAADYCSNIINILTTHPYPSNKLIMPTDFFLHLFSENPGLIVVSKYQSTIEKGVDVVLNTIQKIQDSQEAKRRLSILINILKISEKQLSVFNTKVEKLIEKLKISKQVDYYAALATGIGDYNNYSYALVYFEKALSLTGTLDTETHRELRKNYAFSISKIIGVNMIYDLVTSSNISNKLKRLRIKNDASTLLGKEGNYIEYRNSVSDSDAIFGLSREMFKKQLYPAIKGRVDIKQTILEFCYQNSQSDILSNMEIIVINAINQSDELLSLLMVGSILNEKTAKKSKNIFSGYQILGHLVPKTVLKRKHFEDFDAKFLYDLIKAPQKFRKIEILSVSDEVDVKFEHILLKKRKK